jgi:hypothetical protein
MLMGTSEIRSVRLLLSLSILVLSAWLGLAILSNWNLQARVIILEDRLLLEKACGPNFPERNHHPRKPPTKAI